MATLIFLALLIVALIVIWDLLRDLGWRKFWAGVGVFIAAVFLVWLGGGSDGDRH